MVSATALSAEHVRRPGQPETGGIQELTRKCTRFSCRRRSRSTTSSAPRRGQGTGMPGWLMRKCALSVLRRPYSRGQPSMGQGKRGCFIKSARRRVRAPELPCCSGSTSGCVASPGSRTRRRPVLASLPGPPPEKCQSEKLDSLGSAPSQSRGATPGIRRDTVAVSVEAGQERPRSERVGAQHAQHFPERDPHRLLGVTQRVYAWVWRAQPQRVQDCSSGHQMVMDFSPMAPA
jgi:hypothetical protein